VGARAAVPSYLPVVLAPRRADRRAGGGVRSHARRRVPARRHASPLGRGVERATGGLHPERRRLPALLVTQLDGLDVAAAGAGGGPVARSTLLHPPDVLGDADAGGARPPAARVAGAPFPAPAARGSRRGGAAISRARARGRCPARTPGAATPA